MSVDPAALTPKAGAGLPATGSPVVNLARPASFSCLAGTIPTLPSYAIPTFNSIMLAEHDVMAPQILPGSVLLFGDSITQQCDMSQVSPFSINLGISGDTCAGLLNRLSHYTSALNKARAVHVMIGINDISVVLANATIQDYMMRIFNWLTGPLIWTKILPSRLSDANANIDIVNAYIAGQLAGRPNFAMVDMKTTLVDGSNLLRADLSVDNIHLNAAGNALWVSAIRSALATI